MMFGSVCGPQSLALLIMIILSATGPEAAASEVAPMVAGHLQQGDLAAAEAELQQCLAEEPDDGKARFALGVVKVLAAIEKLGQDQYRYGALSGSVRNLPVLRLPIPPNPEPQEVSYQQVRQVFVDFQARLRQAEMELAKVDVTREVKWELDLAAVRLDFSGDGRADAAEGFLNIFAAVNRPRPGAAPREMKLMLDGGDVLWLRGYCHFLMGFCDIVLAYDHQRLFDHTGQLIYPKHVPSERIAAPLDVVEDQSFDRQIIDLIAALHLMNLPLSEPARMEAARQHLLAMIQTSRQSWELILAETDNEQEWLPNPQQTGVLGVPVTRELIDGWHGVLTEMEELLEGRKLVPFWRDYRRFFGPSRQTPAVGRGVNLKRFFTEPRDFDLILLIQGTAALPYVEQGRLSRPETWENLTRTFRGQFFGFAVWFN